jgi:hypothetical protein
MLHSPTSIHPTDLVAAVNSKSWRKTDSRPLYPSYLVLAHPQCYRKQVAVPLYITDGFKPYCLWRGLRMLLLFRPTACSFDTSPVPLASASALGSRSSYRASSPHGMQHRCFICPWHHPTLRHARCHIPYHPFVSSFFQPSMYLNKPDFSLRHLFKLAAPSLSVSL